LPAKDGGEKAWAKTLDIEVVLGFSGGGYKRGKGLNGGRKGRRAAKGAQREWKFQVKPSVNDGEKVCGKWGACIGKGQPWTETQNCG